LPWINGERCYVEASESGTVVQYLACSDLSICFVIHRSESQAGFNVREQRVGSNGWGARHLADPVEEDCIHEQLLLYHYK
jgi:hypothetical protein